jgi:hypothetical protein
MIHDKGLVLQRFWSPTPIDPDARTDILLYMDLRYFLCAFDILSFYTDKGHYLQ